MLNFWYSERCTRPIKLAVCIVLCSIIYIASQFEKLDSTFTLICLAIGVLTHFLYQFLIKAQQKHFKKSARLIILLLPITTFFIMVYLLPALHLWALALQALGFSVLGLCLVSIYQNRAPRQGVSH